MPEDRSPSLRVDPAKLQRLITTYETAAERVHGISVEIARLGRVRTPWAADTVSVEMAAHYNAQVFEGPYSTYAAVTTYEAELRAVARTIRGILAEYQATEAEAVSAFQAPARSAGGR